VLFLTAASLQLFIVWWLLVIIWVCFVIMGQNTEKGHLTRTTDDVLDDITGSKSDIFVNSDSYVSNYRASAKESTGRHHLFHKPNFPHYCLLTCVNNGSKILFPSFQTQIQDHSMKLLKMRHLYICFHPITTKQSQDSMG
jgi:hypothetical protein